MKNTIFKTMANTTTCLRMRPVVKFIVPDWGYKVNSGIGSVVVPARQIESETQYCCGVRIYRQAANHLATSHPLIHVRYCIAQTLVYVQCTVQRSKQ
jgi:hypothetical protein